MSYYALARSALEGVFVVPPFDYYFLLNAFFVLIVAACCYTYAMSTSSGFLISCLLMAMLVLSFGEKVYSEMAA